jgi:hypothetical protein
VIPQKSPSTTIAINTQKTQKSKLKRRNRNRNRRNWNWSIIKGKRNWNIINQKSKNTNINWNTKLDLWIEKPRNTKSENTKKMEMKRRCGFRSDGLFSVGNEFSLWVTRIHCCSLDIARLISHYWLGMNFF